MQNTLKDNKCRSNPLNTSSLFDVVGIRRIALACVLLAIGSIIYLIFRQNVFFLSWIDEDFLRVFHNDSSFIEKNWLGEFILYSLPDGLWYAALLIILIPLGQINSQLNRSLIIIGILLPFILEILQFFRMLIGTFDTIDLITYVLTFLIIMLCERKYLFFKLL